MEGYVKMAKPIRPTPVIEGEDAIEIIKNMNDSPSEEYKELARKSIVASVKAQKKDGSWVYGLLENQGWIDSFHTGYNLDGMYAYQEITGDYSFEENIKKGLSFYEKKSILIFAVLFCYDRHDPGTKLVFLRR